MSLADLEEQVEEKKQSYDVFRSLRTKKNTVHTLTAAPLVKPG